MIGSTMSKMAAADKLSIPQLQQAIKDGKMKKQHGGNKAESGTFCYYGNRETLAALGAVELK